VVASRTETRDSRSAADNRRRRGIVGVVVVLVLLLAAWAIQRTREESAPSPTWTLRWSDEFAGAAGALPDPARWSYDLGASGWGNAELQEYTDSPSNASLDGRGNLAIVARQDGDRYTSARLKTQDRYAQRYGRVEARIRLPAGNGLWPAFWMLGANIGEAGWPASGEIDIMENLGREPTVIHDSLHGPGYSGADSLTASMTATPGAWHEDFHVFAAEWSPDSIAFFADGAEYARFRPGNLPAGAQWVFDHPFFVILNVAVGGHWPGSPDGSTRFPQAMLVDYVRMYAREAP
jgi:beta-glucanase (GH16 family)